MTDISHLGILSDQLIEKEKTLFILESEFLFYNEFADLSINVPGLSIQHKTGLKRKSEL